MKPKKPRGETTISPTQDSAQAVYLVDGARTPFLKAASKPGPFTPVDLAVQCGRPLLLRQPFPATAFDRVILGCVNVIAEEMNPARVAALRLGMGKAMPAFTVQINCGSGMLSIDQGFQAIREGSADLILAGGAEALSHSPLYFRPAAAAWFGELSGARGPVARLKQFARVKPSYFSPVIGLLKGLTDPVVQLNMGQTAELLGHLFGISRQEADEYAANSHRRLARAQEKGLLDGEVVPAFTSSGELYDADNGVRPDTTAAKLAGLKPVFERPWGNVTAGNSSQITDGASWVVLASPAAVEKHGLQPLARIVDSQWSALDPSVMGLGPVLSITEILKRNNDGVLQGIDLWEINEAFAAQVLACLQAWESEAFCREVLGMASAMGRVPLDQLNIHGGAISLGHPVGTSGNRIVLHLARSLKQAGAARGIASQCVGGGQGGAMLLEAV